MRHVVTVIFFGLTFIGSGTVFAQDPPDTQCQNLANKFGESPNGLAIQELERLRFCVSQALEYREQSLKGELLKGTIIDSQPFSGGVEDTKLPELPKGLQVE